MSFAVGIGALAALAGLVAAGGFIYEVGIQVGAERATALWLASQGPPEEESFAGAGGGT